MTRPYSRLQGPFFKMQQTWSDYVGNKVLMGGVARGWRPNSDIQSLQKQELFARERKASISLPETSLTIFCGSRLFLRNETHISVSF